MKIKFIGDISPGKVKAKGAILRVIKGETYEVDDLSAKSLLANPDFVLVGKEEEEKKEVKPAKKKSYYNYEKDEE